VNDTPEDDPKHRTDANPADDPLYNAAHLEAIVESAVDGMITIDERGVMRSFNPAAERIFGYEADEVIGENVKVLMPSPYREEHDGYLERYKRTGEKEIIGIGREVLGRRKDGSTFPMDLAVSEFWVGDDRYFSGTVRDVTARRENREERERLIDELEQKNAELERFTYTVSHDLKSPLITIKGFLGMLEQDARDGNLERMTADIERIANAADRMKELLDEVLELSRIGRVVNPAEWVDLGGLTRETVTLLSGPLDERGVEVDIAPDLPTVYGDRVRLREVIQNLVENAIKFLGDEPQPCIEVGRRDDDGEPVCFVRDNGVGIDPRYLKKVFGLFEQLDPSHQGTGVGLALVHRIIEVHGGRIWVESEGLGHGTSFCFSLPRVQPPSSPSAKDQDIP
jgi:two-component system, LuxR family, sensor kinase FixL